MIDVTEREVIGQLFMHRPSAHIHYMLHKNFEPVCPYKYFSSEAKTLFDTLYAVIGTSSDPCDGSSYFCCN